MDHLNKAHRVQHLCAASPEEGRTSKCVGLLFFIPTKKSNFSDFKSTFWSMLLFCMWWCGILFGAGYFLRLGWIRWCGLLFGRGRNTFCQG